MTRGEGDARPVGLTLACAFGALYFSLGIYMPFFSLWLIARGLDPDEIGMALAVPLVTRLIATPVLGLLSDRLGRPKAILMWLALASSLMMGALAFSHGAFAIYVVLGITAMAWNPSFSLLDAYTTRQARRGAVDYGRSRLWGSAAFVCANLLGGLLVAQAGAGIVVVLMIAGQVALFAGTLALPELKRPPEVTALGLSRLRVPPVLIAGIAAAALVQASHATLYAFGSLHWAATGISLTVIGALWAIGVGAEIVFFRFGTRAVSRLGPLNLIALGGLAAVIRFASYAYDPPLSVLVVLQLLHGATFGATYLGMVELVARTTPEHRAAGTQSIAAWSVSLTLSGASAAAGAFWTEYGALCFLASAVVGGLGGVLALGTLWLQPQSAGAGGKARAPS
ncbi:MFS transporter [Roseixanthobacter glucoisosaccharinicivorans]|uniref:MFS transporter n=1 Tax=Roseixanthobacter glucoisosaccharinicivorans TaxID=3119923 RepID=UPI003727D3CD